MDENDLVSIVQAMLLGYVDPTTASRYFDISTTAGLLVWSEGRIGFRHGDVRSVLAALEYPHIQEGCVDLQAVLDALHSIELEYTMRFV